MKRTRIRFGVVTAWPDDDWHSQRLLAACRRKGRAVAVDPGELAAILGDGAFDLRTLGRAAESCDVFILARGLGRDGDPDVQFEIYRAMEGAGAVVMNRIDPLLAAQDKFRTSWMLRRAGVSTPRAAVAQTRKSALEALQGMGEAVLKPIAGSLGQGIEWVSDDPAGRRLLVQRVARDRSVYMQAFVPNPGRDLRVFVVGARAVGSVERIAPPGEWLTNVAQGGRVRQRSCRAEEKALAERAALVLGLDYAGVDLLEGPAGPTVLEVNGNPNWQGIMEATGNDMAEPIAEHALLKARQRLQLGGWSPFHMGVTHG